MRAAPVDEGVLKWLLGEQAHPDTGEWFERPEGRVGNYWWRTELRAAMGRPSLTYNKETKTIDVAAAPAPVDGLVERMTPEQYADWFTMSKFASKDALYAAMLREIQSLAAALQSRDEPVAMSERDIKIHANDCPKVWAFFSKHALGSKMCPSCLACGHPSLITGDGAIRHMELPDIYICENCVATLRPTPPRKP